MTHMNSAAYMEPLNEYSYVNATESVNLWPYDYSISSGEAHEDLIACEQPIVLVSNGNLTKKIKTEHERFKCIHCDATFSSSSNCRSHERTHTGEKPYKCPHCPNRFIQNSNLKSHMRVHTGEKPFKCKSCRKRFSRTSHLKGHERTHSGELPYDCKFCTNRFSSRSMQRKHEIMHEMEGNYFCEICEVPFEKKECWKIHMNIHSKDKPYFCGYCIATFRSKDDLSAHRKLHPAFFYPFRCPKCTKGFKIRMCYEKHFENCQSNVNSESDNFSLQDYMNQNRNQLSQDFAEFDVVHEDYLFSKPICKLELFEEEEPDVCRLQKIEESIENEIDGCLNSAENEKSTVIVNIGADQLFNTCTVSVYGQ